MIISKSKVCVCLSEHSVMGYDVSVEDPIKVSQFGFEQGAFCDFYFFWKSTKNQNDHLKKVCDELFGIKNLRWQFWDSYSNGFEQKNEICSNFFLSNPIQILKFTICFLRSEKILWTSRDKNSKIDHYCQRG